MWHGLTNSPTHSLADSLTYSGTPKRAQAHFTGICSAITLSTIARSRDHGSRDHVIGTVGMRAPRARHGTRMTRSRGMHMSIYGDMWEESVTHSPTRACTRSRNVEGYKYN